ncbi:4-aminobutyrate aminotransferase/(S)-3-amino-2-methylpropionate transaminase [Kineococcus radiotolerans]|uniref:(S)-3-amino-2-methylpropionate transaminase n=2 Tax=Kineococcus radiotolerans TaxID=131568 RepID=A6W7X3_KINRD|nr:4-aminobutyrate--2-oxoglutarate transaminase [Kineococcus radiotolerans]ABS02912.1 4-aminobutyrate aminotransferase [Kineococcus radiotolerans SRS30216 = ATCC BAA-149]MBB2899888.1 4-aminobutyrate aminotransferase/(S)-3-amino-2-methylpropionate transaminase [Kineococcus radiotolerans]
MTTLSSPDATSAPAVGGPALPQEIRLRTEVPGPLSRELAARRVAAVSAAVGSSMPFYAAVAGGGVVVDVDGNSYADLGSGIAVTTVGNADPAVVAAVGEQVGRFTHTCFMITPYDSYVAVAERLNALTPGDFPKRTALFSTGAEAVENAVKVARAFTGRQAVVVFDHAYHGRTNLTMAMTAKNMPYKNGFGPFAPEVYRAPLSYPFRDGLDGPTAAARAIATIEKQVGAANLAAVVVEPVQGEGGFIVPAPGFLPAIAAWARENGVVFVADEVQTGIARTGAVFASHLEGIEPDLVTIAKGVAGGLPLAAVTGRAEILDAPVVGGLGGTYGGNPAACAAALATLDAVEHEDLPARARQLEGVLLRRLHALAAVDPRVGDVRGRGAMVAVELVRPGTTEPDAALAKRVAADAARRGVIVLTCGTDGNVLRFLPPLSIPDALLEEAFDVLDDVFATDRPTAR